MADVKILGLRELDRELRSFPRKMQKRALSSALRAAARPVVKRVRAAAPRDTGALRRAVTARFQPARFRSRRFARVINVGVEHGRVNRGLQAVFTGKRTIKTRGRTITKRLNARERRGDDPFYYRFQEEGWHATGRRRIRGGKRRRARSRNLLRTTGAARFIPGKHFIRDSLPKARTAATEAFRQKLRQWIDRQRAKGAR